MSEKEKNLTHQDESKECTLDTLEQVSGGANPFADVKRVTTHKIDEDLREKI